jgi:hypothetical protein
MSAPTKAEQFEALLASWIMSEDDEELEAVNATIFNGEWRAEAMQKAAWDASSVVNDANIQSQWVVDNVRFYDT